ncbi:hypothetical protein HDU98_003632 [Podochytrium sp. JEL0797]|nr:hypothetical protein HDU98_003632 [Podochytrium sp. JEL0797]
MHPITLIRPNFRKLVLSRFVILFVALLVLAFLTVVPNGSIIAKKSAVCDVSGSSSASTVQYSFNPSGEVRKFKAKAVVTLYEATQGLKVYDSNFADTLLLAHAFNRTSDIQDVEFVVGYVGNLTERQHESLRGLGVRVVPLPSLPSEKGWPIGEESFKPCLACFSKLYLFGMDMYEEVLFLDSRVVIGSKFSLRNVFAESRNQTGFFGAVASHGLGSDVFDSGVLLFKPSMSRMQSMLRSLRKHHLVEYFMEQTFLNAYFGGKARGSCTPWTRLPDSLNFQNAHVRNPKAVLNAGIVPHAFWAHPPENRSVIDALLWSRWKSNIKSLLAMQLSQTNRSDVGIVPPRFQDFQDTLRANTFGSTFVILTVMTEDTEPEVMNRTLANRANYIAKHPQVFHHWQTEIVGKNAVWQKAYSAQELVHRFDWVWLLDGRDALIMNAETDLRVLVARLVLEVPQLDVDILIARDMHGMNAGSFFLRSSEWTRDQFIPQWKTHEPDEHNWYEQIAIIRMHENKQVETEKHLYEVPQSRQNLFNAYTWGPDPLYQPGDLVIHSPMFGWGFLYEFLASHNYTEV